MLARWTGWPSTACPTPWPNSTAASGFAVLGRLPTRAITTARATKRGDDFVLNGQKLWITNAREAGLFIVFATLDIHQAQIKAKLIGDEITEKLLREEVHGELFTPQEIQTHLAWIEREQVECHADNQGRR